MEKTSRRPEIRMDGFDGDWEEKQIGDVLTEEKRFIALEDETEYHLVTVKRRNEGIVSRGFLFGKNILVKNYTRIRSGDYLISRRQIVHGANGLVPPTLDNAIVSNEYLVASENDEISTEFLTLLSQTPEMYRKFMLSSYGVDIEKMVFNVEDWKNRNIVIPGNRNKPPSAISSANWTICSPCSKGKSPRSNASRPRC